MELSSDEEDHFSLCIIVHESVPACTATVKLSPSGQFLIVWASFESNINNINIAYLLGSRRNLIGYPLSEQVAFRASAETESSSRMRAGRNGAVAIKRQLIELTCAIDYSLPTNFTDWLEFHSLRLIRSSEIISHLAVPSSCTSNLAVRRLLIATCCALNEPIHAPEIDSRAKFWPTKTIVV